MTPDEVLTWWFGAPAHDAEKLMQKIKRWYQGGPDLDREIAAKFGEAIEAALRGDLDAWAATPRDRLALLILLDQFTRSVYRDTPRAWSGDEKALSLATEALDRGWDRDLGPFERNFLLMPLLHAEDLAAQERVVVEMDRLHDDAPEWARMMFAMGREQTRKYRDVIARFGRFPHRNEALGRTSTPEEIEFMKTFVGPPSAMRSA